MPSNQDAQARGRECGERLRTAREAAGLSIADVSARLRIPERVIQSLEAGDASHADAPVFVRGQLRSYARLLGVRLDDVPEASAASQIQPTRIVPMTYTPPLQRFADKLMGRMVYIVITALIAVPVWMATRGHIDGSIQSASLEMPTDAVLAARDGEALPERPRAIAASMASLPARQQPVRQEPALSLRFSDESWVEIFDRDGQRVEQGLFKAGDRRDFEAGTVGRVVLGNARTVEVLRGGHVQDLSAYRRADVARFTVSSDGSLAPIAE
ncbi:helix-turn-helix domain-containing protein [Luteimonas aestuarii]|nr:RodZ domain-containing protein [Luteimonas aestuarii]